jgi:hypothetical protein
MSNQYRRSWARLPAYLCALGSMLLVGCAQIQLGAPVASADNIQKAKASGLPASNVGPFVLEAGKDAKMDKGLDIRSNTLSAPTQGSFAAYLKETLVTELKAAGLYDAGSKTVISGKLVDSQLDAAMAGGSGRLAARFAVSHAGKVVFDKEFSASDKWESSFVGAIAIPAAINNYSALYRKVVGQLLDDADFRRAVAGVR